MRMKYRERAPSATQDIARPFYAVDSIASARQKCKSEKHWEVNKNQENRWSMTSTM